MTHIMFDELTFNNDFEFNYNDDSHVDKYLMDLLYPTPKPMLLPEFDPYKFDPYKVEPYNTTNYSCVSNFFIFIGVLQFGMFFGFLTTSLIYNYMIDWNIDEDFLEKEDIPYEKKYKLKKRDTTRDIHADADSDEFKDIIPSENTFIQEVTPDGMVFMNYSNDEEGFTYWSDNNIRFSYLETVARRFVNCFGCSHLYIERECNKEIYDSDYEVESQTSDNDETNEDFEHLESNVNTVEKENEDSVGDSTQDTEQNDDNDEKDDTSGPFAKLKTYNIRSNTGSDETNDTKHPNNTSCKFIRKGKLSEFKITQDIEINEPKQKMTFASFKAMFINDTKA